MISCHSFSIMHRWFDLRIMLCLMKLNGCVCHKLILTPFSPFDIISKTSGDVFLAAKPFRIFVDYVTIFNSSPMQHLRWNS